MPDFLPAKYAFSHDYAVFLNDILSAFVRDGEQVGLFTAQIRLKDRAEATAFTDAPDDHKWEWLKANGYGDALSGVIYKHVIVALLSDFCHFVFEALSCSRKGKLTVAYSLLRKPFKDNLFYLEWLLADPAGFIAAFSHDGPDKLEEFRSKRHLRFPLIEKAISQTSTRGMFDAAFIDEIRYDRKLEYGFAASWDQASHLITTFPAIRTSPESFNFVFLNPQDGEQWEFLYSRLPMLLYYAIEVVEALIARLLPHPELLADTTSNRREIGYMLWTASLGGADLALDSDAIPLPPCPQCGLSSPMDKANMLSYYNDLKITCRGCGTVNAIPDQANQPRQEGNNRA